jgi:hypothetical protein
MAIPTTEVVVNFDESSIPILNKIIEDIRSSASTVRYVTTVPTADNVQHNEIVVYDDGTNTEQIYFKTGKNELKSISTALMIIENRTDDPASPVAGQIWFRTDL